MSKLKTIPYDKLVEFAKLFGYRNVENRLDLIILLLKLFGIMYFNPSSRLSIYKIVRNALKDKDPKPQICGDDDKLLDIIHLGKIAGAGSYGVVYFSKVHIDSLNIDANVAVKFDKIINYKTYQNEILIHRHLNEIVKKGICPNFPLQYASYQCSMCSKLERYGSVKLKNASCVVTCMEKLDGDTLTMFQNQPEVFFNQIDILYFQIGFALKIMENAGYDHGDVDLRNILYKKVSTMSNTYWTYILGSNVFYIPNEGYMFFISDFGKSKSVTFNNIGCNMLLDSMIWVTENMKGVSRKLVNDRIFRFKDAFNKSNDEFVLMFDHFRTKPVGGIEIGRYNGNEEIPENFNSNIDIIYLPNMMNK